MQFIGEPLAAKRFASGRCRTQKRCLRAAEGREMAVMKPVQAGNRRTPSGHTSFCGRDSLSAVEL